MTIPEIGTIKATHPPLRHPDLEPHARAVATRSGAAASTCGSTSPASTRKSAIVDAQGARASTSGWPGEISRFMETLRTLRLAKVPGRGRDASTGRRRWPRCTPTISTRTLVTETLGCVLKDADDIKRFKRELASGGLGRFVAAQAERDAGAPRPHCAPCCASAACCAPSGLPVTIAEMMDAVRALEVVDLMDRHEVYLALRTMFVTRPGGAARLRPLLRGFWRFQADEGQGLDGLSRPGRSRPSRTTSTAGNSRGEAAQKQARWRSTAGRRRRTTTTSRSRCPALSDREVADGAGLLDLSAPSSSTRSPGSPCRSPSGWRGG